MSAISGYRIQISTEGSSWSNPVANTGSTVAGYSDAGLTAGSTRHYRVSAINPAGTGTPSNVATTDSAPPAGAAFTGEITRCSGSRDSSTSLATVTNAGTVTAIREVDMLVRTMEGTANG